MKWSKTKSLITLLVLAGLSLVSWTLYRYYNEQYYGQYSQYTGKAEIDDYEIIAKCPNRQKVSDRGQDCVDGFSLSR